MGVTKICCVRIWTIVCSILFYFYVIVLFTYVYGVISFYVIAIITISVNVINFHESGRHKVGFVTGNRSHEYVLGMFYKPTSIHSLYCVF